MKKSALICAVAAAVLAACAGALVGCSGGNNTGDNNEEVEHTHAFTMEYPNGDYLCEEATCTRAETYYYRCAECWEKGTETFEYGEPLGHEFSPEFTVDKEANCTEDGLISKHCIRCEEVEEQTVIEALGHDFGTKWLYTADKHWRECSRCEELNGDGAHIVAVDNDFHVRACESCSYTVNTDGWNAETGLEYTLNDDGQSYAVTGIKVDFRNVFVPLEYDGLPVTKIGDGAFYNNDTLQTVVLQNNIEEICETAFSGCDNLQAIRIPASLTQVGSFAFERCAKLTKLYISDVAAYCNIAQLYLYNENMHLYINNEEVVDLVIPDGVEEIPDRRFADIASIESIYIPSTVTQIGNFYLPEETAFSGLANLKSITVAADNPVFHSDGNCLIKINDKAIIRGCGESVIPTDGSVTVISDGAFYGNKQLKSIVIPEGITSISHRAFYGCSNLDEISLPESLTFIGGDAFVGCGDIGDYYGGGNVYYVGNWAVGYINGSTHLNIALADGTVGLAYGAFENYGGLRTIGLPDSLKYVCDYAFGWCAHLQSIELPYGVKEIPSSVFIGCSSLTRVVLPDSVESIGEGAFSGCTGLTGIKLGNGIKFVNGFAFGLRETDMATGVMKTVNGVTYVDTCVLDCDRSVTEVTLKDGVRVIAGGAFGECSDLTSITIGKDVVAIAQYAFLRCTALEEINYAGTKAEWAAIDKATGWAEQTNRFVVHCSDGDAY